MEKAVVPFLFGAASITRMETAFFLSVILFPAKLLRSRSGILFSASPESGETEDSWMH